MQGGRIGRYGNGSSGWCPDVIRQLAARWRQAGPAPGGRGGGATDLRSALLAELPRLRRYALALVGDVTMADDLLQRKLPAQRRAVSEPAQTGEAAVVALHGRHG